MKPNTVDPDPLLSELPLPIRKRLVTKIYALLSLQLLCTVGMASVFTMHPPLQVFVVHHPSLYSLSVGLAFASMFAFTCCFQRRHPFDSILFWLFTISEAYSLSALSATYAYYGGGYLVLQSGMITLLVFSCLTLYVFYSKRDFSFLEPFLCASFLVVWGMSLVATFSIPLFSFVKVACSAIGVLVFTGYILYDTSVVLRTIGPDDALIGAMQLYMDIVNLFVFLLQCMTSSRD